MEFGLHQWVMEVDHNHVKKPSHRFRVGKRGRMSDFTPPMDPGNNAQMSSVSVNFNDLPRKQQMQTPFLNAILTERLHFRDWLTQWAISVNPTMYGDLRV